MNVDIAKSRTTAKWRNSGTSTSDSIPIDEVADSIDRTNFRDVDLPTVLEDIEFAKHRRSRKSTKPGTKSADDSEKLPGGEPDEPDEPTTKWGPPINPFYTEVPIGLNTSLGVHSSEIMNATEIITNSTAAYANISTKSIFDKPPAQPVPPLVRPKREEKKKSRFGIDPPTNTGRTKGGTKGGIGGIGMGGGGMKGGMGGMKGGMGGMESFQVKEGFEEAEDQEFDGSERVSELMNAWKTAIDNPNIDTIKYVASMTLISLADFFYVPELLSIVFVNALYQEGNKPIPKTDDYMNDIYIVEKHLKQYAMLIFGLTAAFNWWYLFFYTDHYIDFTSVLESKLLNPVSWIIGPAASATVILNYYLLGKRREEYFYNNFVRPIINNKSMTITVFFIIFTALYVPCSKYYSQTLRDIVEGAPNQLYGIVLVLGCFTYLYKVVFDIQTLKNAHEIFQSFVLTAIIFLIIFIFVVIASKLSVILVLFFLSFYSTFPLWVFTWASGSNPYSKIIEMINDTRETCVPKNPTGSSFIAVKNFLYQNLFFLFLAGLYLTIVISAMVDLPNIRHAGLKALSSSFYSCFLIVPVLVFIFGMMPIAEEKKLTPPDVNINPEAPIEAPISGIMKMLTAFILLLELIIYIPFYIVSFKWTNILIPNFNDWLIHDYIPISWLTNGWAYLWLLIPNLISKKLKQHIIPKKYRIYYRYEC